MDLSSINPILLIASLMVAATPILLAAIGEMVVEKAGVLNLGVEGMMITGAVVGFAIGVNTGSPALGFVAAAIGGAAVSMLFGILTQYLLSNQVATGLGLTLFGLGLSSLIGKPYEGIKSPVLQKLDIPVLSDLPIVGPILFGHDPVVYLSLILVAGVWYALKYSRAGRGLYQPCSRAPMGRGADRRRRLDRSGDRCFCLVAPMAGSIGRLLVWWGFRIAAQFASGGPGHSGRIPFHEPLCHHNRGSGLYFGARSAWRTGITRAKLPCVRIIV